MIFPCQTNPHVDIKKSSTFALLQLITWILFFVNVTVSASHLISSIQVFIYGVVFCSHCQLQEKAKISSAVNQQQQQQLYEPRCLPLPLLRLLTTDRQREWWDAIYNLIHTRAAWVSELKGSRQYNTQEMVGPVFTCTKYSVWSLMKKGTFWIRPNLKYPNGICCIKCNITVIYKIQLNISVQLNVVNEEARAKLQLHHNADLQKHKLYGCQTVSHIVPNRSYLRI